MKRQPQRRGFTLIELSVVCAVLCLLVALLLPAAQAAREAAKRAQCASNMRQIALAVHQYEQVAGCFPSSALPGALGNPNLSMTFYSVHTRVLPYLDHQPLYNAVNFLALTYPETWLLTLPEADAVNSLNSTVQQTGLAVFLCPTDGGRFADIGVNYRGNSGLGPQYLPSSEHPDSGNGLLPEMGLVAPASAPDGLSHTALLSERLRGSGGPAIDAERDAFGLDLLVLTADDLLLDARAVARASNGWGYCRNGHSWFWTGRERTVYNHAQVPNGTVPDAIYSNNLTARGMATARSRHLGGVNVIMGDGSARFVEETISQVIWRGLGTRNGHELVD